MDCNLHTYDKQMTETIDWIRQFEAPSFDLTKIPDLGPVNDVWKILIADKEIDSINQVRVSELIPFIGSMILEGSPDFMIALSEQLTDMRSGICQPGRTIRLCQLILVYYKYDLKE